MHDGDVATDGGRALRLLTTRVSSGLEPARLSHTGPRSVQDAGTTQSVPRGLDGNEDGDQYVSKGFGQAV